MENELYEQPTTSLLPRKPLVQLDADGYVVGFASYVAYGVELPNSIEVDELPENFETEYHHYKIAENGALTKDESYFSAIDRENIKLKGKTVMMSLIEKQFLAAATDEEAYKMRYMYNEWQAGNKYTKGQRCIANDHFYRVEQDHTAAAEWPPAATPSLYTEIQDPTNEWPEWVQPTRAEDSYSLGVKVTHNGNRYVSQIEANTTEPGTDERWWAQYEV